MPVPPAIKTTGKIVSSGLKRLPPGLLTKTSEPTLSSQRFLTKTEELTRAAIINLSLI